VLVGGPGADRLFGKQGRDVVIGGNGADQVQGNEGSDILIAGRTSFDINVGALDAIMAEWSAPHDYPTRVKNLRNGTGGGAGGPRNGTTFLRNIEPGRTVHDDRQPDSLAGGVGRDWFFARIGRRVADKILDRNGNETVHRI
jgi:Ca2+-binding RTX toxin-like protein